LRTKRERGKRGKEGKRERGKEDKRGKTYSFFVRLFYTIYLISIIN
jgi:hypothetical protein